MRRFVVCHCGALGDLVLTWGTLGALRRRLAGHEFVGIGRREYMRLAQRLGLVDSCEDMDSRELLGFFAGESIPGRFDGVDGGLLFLPDGEKQRRLLARGASLPVLVIPPFPEGKDHVARHYFRVAGEAFGIGSDMEIAETFHERAMGGRYVLIHPGSGSEKKNYSLDLYRGIADAIRELGASDVRFVLGPVELEGMDAGWLDDERVETPGDVSALSELISGAMLYVGNDSGATHLAGYLGVPTIGMYKVTDPEVWGVLGRCVEWVRAADEPQALDGVVKIARRFIGAGNDPGS